MRKLINTPKLLIAYTHDILAVFLALIGAYFIRFNFDIPLDNRNQILEILPFIVIPQSLFFLYIGIYRGLWRFASLPDLKRIFMGALFALFLIIICK